MVHAKIIEKRPKKGYKQLKRTLNLSKWFTLEPEYRQKSLKTGQITNINYFNFQRPQKYQILGTRKVVQNHSKQSNVCIYITLQTPKKLRKILVFGPFLNFLENAILAAKNIFVPGKLRKQSFAKPKMYSWLS